MKKLLAVFLMLSSYAFGQTLKLAVAVPHDRSAQLAWRNDVMRVEITTAAAESDDAVVVHVNIFDATDNLVSSPTLITCFNEEALISLKATDEHNEQVAQTDIIVQVLLADKAGLAVIVQ